MRQGLEEASMVWCMRHRLKDASWYGGGIGGLVHAWWFGGGGDSLCGLIF
jgi:hypothetical protein